MTIREKAVIISNKKYPNSAMKGILSPQSIRGMRTSSSLSSSPKPSHSDLMQLNSVNSDDSSVFSGLGSEVQSLSEEQDENKSVRSVRFQDEEEWAQTNKQTKVKKKKKKKKKLLKASNVGKYLFNTHDGGNGNSSVEKSEFTSALRSVGSRVVSGSDRSALRNLSSVADDDSAFMSPKSQGFLCDNDSTMSFDSVNQFDRPIGTRKLLSDVQIFDGIQEDDEENTFPQTPEGAEEFTNMLKTFEEEIDANISGIRDDDESDHIIGIPYWQDFAPREVISDDGSSYVSYEQAKQMQRVLHQARKEVEMLRDNNESFMSEIEQTEEEHESEMKLLDERTKQKFSELKAMYQQEMDHLTQEKDAAIIQATRQAVRYGEAGRKQITRLKKQIERLKLHAQETVKKAVEEAALTVKKKKDNEMMVKIHALQKSYDEKIERMKGDAESRLRDAVNEAVANVVTDKMLADRQPEVNMQLETKDDARRDVISLRQERDAMLKTLESIMDNINNHYPEQMEELRRQNRGTQNPMRLLQAGSQNESPIENSFKEVIEAFAFLLEQADGKIKSAQIKKERSEVYIQARHDLMIKHRTELEYARKQSEDAMAEIERLKKQQNDTFERVRGDVMSEHKTELEHSRKKAEESKEKIQKLEQSLKTMGREKRALQEKFRRDNDNHRNEVKQLKDRIQELESGREVPKVYRERYQQQTIPGILSDIRAASQEMRDDDESDRSDEQMRESATAIDTPESTVSRFGAYPITSPMSSLMPSETLEIRSSTIVSDTFTPVILGTPPTVPESLDLKVSLKDKDKTDDATLTESQNLSSEKQEPIGSKEGCSPTEVLEKRRNFGILHGFKNSSSPSCSRDPLASSQGKEPEGKADLLEENGPNQQNLQSTLDMDGNKKIRDSRRESTSSLKTEAGITTPRSESVPGQIKISEGENATSSTDARAMKWKKRNPLGMFANKRAPSSPSRSDSQRVVQHNTIFSDPNTSASDHSFSDRATNDSSQLEKPHGGTRDNKFVNASREVMNNPLSGFDSKSSENSSAVMNVINGKKPPLPEWSHAPDGKIFTQEKHPENVQVPATIDVQTRNDQQIGSSAVNGHTMCLRPHSVEKKSVLGGFSCGGGKNIENQGSSSDTSVTAPSTDDDAPPRRVSQQEMREFPPLGDHSDDESRDGLNDKYASFEPPVEYVQESSRRFNEGNAIPIVMSRSVQDSSPVIYMDSSSDSKPIVVQGQPIHRNTALSAFITPRPGGSKTSSTTGSEATTTITAHTFRSAYNNDVTKLRDLHQAKTSGQGRRQSNFAAMKARRARRHADM